MTRWGLTTLRFMGLVGFLYDKMGTYNIALYGSGRFLV